MKNRFLTIILILSLCASLFTGCSSNDSDDTSDAISALGISTSTYPTVADEHYTYIDGAFQPYWGWESYIKRYENGYYYINNNLLYYFDMTDKTSAPLCSAADCNHSDENCPAYLGEYNDGSECGFLQSGLESYNNNVYVIGYEKNELYDFYVYRISMDGSEREKLFCLYSLEPSSDSSLLMTYNFIMHMGCYYGVPDYDNDKSLSKIDLSGNKQKILDLNDKYEVDIQKFFGYGDYVYFQAQWYEDAELTEYCNYLYRYNINTEELEILSEDIFLNGNNFFIIDEDTILCMGMDLDVSLRKISTGEVITEIYPGDDYSFFSYDGVYVYVQDFETFLMTVYDLDGNVIDRFSCGDYSCLFGDSNYLICSSFSDPALGTAYDTYSIWALDKSQIGSESKLWIKLKNYSG